MAEQPRTQKQIAQKYKDNLDYYRHGHYFRRLKLLLFLLTVVGSLGAVFGLRWWGSKEYFSTGPLSQNHARFANNCEVCHEGAVTDLTRALKIDQAVTNLSEGHLPTLDLDQLKAKAKDVAGQFSVAELQAAAQRNLSPERLSDLRKVIIQKSSLAAMDRACLKCHDPFKLHQPQGEAIALRSVHPELPLVHADRCSTCHREHVGHGRMKFPESETCATCHANPAELLRTRNAIKISSPNPPSNFENRDIGEGIIRFIAPQSSLPGPAIIRSYADGHPAFQYEAKDARDPAILNFNHRRHEQADIPPVDGHRITCTDCHQPGSGGVYYQRVQYEQHCARCHSLHLSPDLPQVKIPHGNPEEVRAFLRSLNTQYITYFMKERGVTDRTELGRLVVEQFDKFRDRGMTGEHAGDELERRVFFAGDPPQADPRISPKPNAGLFFPPCAKCHQVTGGDGATPKVAKTNIADRWVNHGPFNHRPHKHMACIDCHGAAKNSTQTSDILMPKQAICAECHRPLQKDVVGKVFDGGLAPRPGTPEMAASQRREGGVKWECESCHKFHAAPEAIKFLEAQAAH